MAESQISPRFADFAALRLHPLRCDLEEPGGGQMRKIAVVSVCTSKSSSDLSAVSNTGEVETSNWSLASTSVVYYEIRCSIIKSRVASPEEGRPAVRAHPCIPPLSPSCLGNPFSLFTAGGLGLFASFCGLQTILRAGKMVP